MSDDRISKMSELLNGILGGWREKIPHQFWQHFQGKPFTKCSYCFQPLELSGTRYLVQKHYLNGELNQETVICFECRAKLRAHYSEESQKIAKEFYAKEKMRNRVGFVADLDSSQNRAHILTKTCLICDVEKRAIDEYLEYAYCEGEEIVFYVHPFMMCLECALKLNENISEKTRDARQRFWEEHFGFPPTDSAKKDSEVKIEILFI